MTRRGTILSLTPVDVVARWLTDMLAVPEPPDGAPTDGSAGGVPINYRLTAGYNGGADPTAKHCCSWSYGLRTPTADCIGFILHGVGIDRYQPGYKGTRGEWLNCHSLVADANGKQQFVRRLKLGEEVLAGDLILTEDHIGGILRSAVRRAQRANGRPDYDDPDWDHLVIDCSPRHGRTSAIGIGRAWSDQCIIVRPQTYVGRE